MQEENLANGSERLDKFRALLKQNNLDAYIVVHNDAHDSEYIASCDERICYICGFSGSNGLAFISQTHAILWTDSRYYIQAEKELFSGWVMRKMEKGEMPWFQYVKTILPGGNVIGFDPLLISAGICDIRMKYFHDNGLKFLPVKQNLVDQLWVEKPALPSKPVFVHDVEFCGEAAPAKIKKVFTSLLLLINVKEHNNFGFLTSKLDEIAYLLNLRGSDIDYNPVFLSYLFIEFSSDGQYQAHLFINNDRLEPSAKTYLDSLSIKLHGYNDIFDFLSTINTPIIVDKNSCNFSLINTISNPDLIISKPSPIEMMKAVKNERELQGLRDCHVRDGAAVVAYLAWLHHELLIKKRTDLTEYSAPLQLENYRKMQKFNKGLSFETISAIGPNGAIVHYSPEEKTAAVLNPNEVYLLDSGGQYLDGTTDITRTVHFTTPTPEEKNAYTRVLLGNLDLERVNWPSKWRINGGDLDVLARRRLWEVGLDYGHGTGHGVGYFLNVHEGPHGISKGRETPLEIGMMVSDEPGYYEKGKFGIRIENCILVVKSQHEGFLTFENITLAPYDRNLIEIGLLSEPDKIHINKYHEKVLEKLMPVLKEMKVEEYVEEWLRNATKPL